MPLSPQFLAFEADRDELERDALYAVDLTGDLAPVELPSDRRADDPPVVAASWSPDGRWLAAIDATQDAMQTVVMDASRGLRTHRRLDPGHRHWSPDGRWLAIQAYQDGLELVLASVESDAVTRTPLSATSDISWSPSSDAVAVAPATGDGHELAVVRVDGSVTTIAIERSSLGSFLWSPGGDALTFVDGRFSDDLSETLWLASPDTGESEPLHSAQGDGRLVQSWGDAHTLFVHDDGSDELRMYDMPSGESHVLEPPGWFGRFFVDRRHAFIVTIQDETVTFRGYHHGALTSADRHELGTRVSYATFTADPRHVIFHSGSDPLHLNRATGQVRWLTGVPGDVSVVSPSPDDARVALSRRSGDGQQHVMIVDLDRARPTATVGRWEDVQVTPRPPVWGSPRWFAFVVDDQHLYLGEAPLQDWGAEEPLLLHAGRSNLRTLSWVSFQPVTP